MNDLYTKLNTQIQNICIEQLKMIKANDLNTNQIDTLREQYQLLLKQIQYVSELFITRIIEPGSQHDTRLIRNLFFILL
jgi:hypothetical protein